MAVLSGGRNNEVTVLPRWPQGGVSLYLIVTYLGGFWYLYTPCIRKSTTLNNVYEFLER